MILTGKELLNWYTLYWKMPRKLRWNGSLDFFALFFPSPDPLMPPSQIRRIRRVSSVPSCGSASPKSMALSGNCQSLLMGGLYTNSSHRSNMAVTACRCYHVNPKSPSPYTDRNPQNPKISPLAFRHTPPLPLSSPNPNPPLSPHPTHPTPRSMIWPAIPGFVTDFLHPGALLSAPVMAAVVGGEVSAGEMDEMVAMDSIVVTSNQW